MSDEYDDIPEPIRRAFANHTYLSTPTVARLLDMGAGTLRQHQQAGHIRWHQKGLGQARPRRGHTFLDVAQFIRDSRHGRLQCVDDRQRFSDAGDHRSGSTTLRSKVIDFRRVFANSGPNVTKRQRKRI
jgi:hypothetical protein